MKRLILLLLLAVLFSGCGQSLYMKGRQFTSEKQYSKAIAAFQEDLLENPDSYKAWRELGVAYYNDGQYTRAMEALDEALMYRSDPRTYLFLGLTFEKSRLYERAAESYRAALASQPGDELAERIRARLEGVNRREFIHFVLTHEDSIQVDTIPENTVAVYDFDGSSLPENLTPLAVGLAEFTALSLSKVESLDVVERMKLHLLLRELKLAEGDYVDPKTVPRIGKLLGSHHVVTGWIDNPAVQRLRMGSAIFNVVDNSEAYPQAEEGKLDRILKLQVAFVYHVLEQLGVEPTPEERRAIETLPTQRYDAFLAYSRALHHKSRGEFQEAQQELQEAVTIDNSFTEAQQELSEVVTLNADQQFEEFVQTQTIPPPSSETLGPTISSVVEDAGAIDAPDDESGESGDETPDVDLPPPHIPKGSLNVTGTIND